MEGLIAAFIMTLAFSVMAPIWKQARNNGAPTKAVLAISGITVPIWLFLGLLVSQSHPYVWSVAYLLVVVGWVVLVMFRHTLALFLFRHKALTEIGAYSVAFSLIVSLLIDTIFFREVFSLNTLVAFCFFLAAGLVITHNRVRFASSAVGLAATLGILALVSVLSAIFFAIYKVGLGMQSNILLHVAISQLLLHTILLIWGYKDLKKSIRKGWIKKRHLVMAAIFLTIGVFGEAYALADLPISYIVMTMLVPIFIFAISDLKMKEVTFSKHLPIALLLTVIGAVILVV